MRNLKEIIITISQFLKSTHEKLRDELTVIQEYKNVINFYIIYCLFGVFFMEQYIGEYCSSISIINKFVAKHLVFIYPLVYFVGIKMINRWGREEKYKKIYYATRCSEKNIISRIKNIDYEKKLFGQILGMVFAIFIAALCIVKIEIVKAWMEEIHKIIWTNTSIYLALIIGIYTLIITVHPMVSSYIDKRCMLFDAYKLAPMRVVFSITMASVIDLFVIFVLYISKREHNWLLVVETVWEFLILVIIGIYVIAIVQPIIMEKNVIKKIDIVYNVKKNYITPSRKWYRGTAINHMENLYERYKKVAKKINLSNIRTMDFDCVYSDREENLIIAKKASRNLWIWAIWFVLTIFFVFYSNLGSFSISCLGIAAVGIIPAIIALVDKRVWHKKYKVINELGNISVWGYYVKLVKKEKVLFFSSHYIIPSKYKKYVTRLKKIGCFYNLAVKMEYEDTKCFDFIGVDYLCDCLEDDSRINSELNGLLLAPILLCACLSMKKKKKIEKRIAEIMEKIIVEQREKEWVKRICLCVLRDIEGNDESYAKCGYQEMLDKLLVMNMKKIG